MISSWHFCYVTVIFMILYYNFSPMCQNRLSRLSKKLIYPAFRLISTNIWRCFLTMVFGKLFGNTKCRNCYLSVVFDCSYFTVLGIHISGVSQGASSNSNPPTAAALAGAAFWKAWNDEKKTHQALTFHPHCFCRRPWKGLTCQRSPSCLACWHRTA